MPFCPEYNRSTCNASKETESEEAETRLKFHKGILEQRRGCGVDLYNYFKIFGCFLFFFGVCVCVLFFCFVMMFDSFLTCVLMKSSCCFNHRVGTVTVLQKTNSEKLKNILFP